MEKIKSPAYVIKRAQELRRNQTPTERALWAHVRNGRIIGMKFRRQHPLGRYIADFYCHEACLVIELEGNIHSTPDRKQYDAIREDVIEQLGIQVLYFDNNNVTHDLHAVLVNITEVLDDSLSPLPKGEGWPKARVRAPRRS